MFNTLLTATLFDGAGAAVVVDSALAVGEPDEETDVALEETDFVDVDLALAVLVVVVAVSVETAFVDALAVSVEAAFVEALAVLVAETVLPPLGVTDWTVLEDSITNCGV